MTRQPMMRMFIMNYLVNHDEISGYHFIQYCRQHGIAASPGNVYPQLAAFEEEGILRHRLEGKRKVYTLTDRGCQMLKSLPVSRVPETLRGLFVRNMSFASTVNWNDPDDVQKLLDNAYRSVGFLENYIKELKTKLGSEDGES